MIESGKSSEVLFPLQSKIYDKNSSVTSSVVIKEEVQNGQKDGGLNKYISQLPKGQKKQQPNDDDSSMTKETDLRFEELSVIPTEQSNRVSVITDIS